MVKSLIRKSALGLGILVVAAGLTGCTKYATPEQLNQLEMKKAEIRELGKANANLQSERERLQKEIASKKARLEECEKLKSTTKANLDKLPK